MVDARLKNEVRTYYETHNSEVKEVASKFGVSERTLYSWIKAESWQAGRLVASGQVALSKNIAKSELASRYDYLKRTIIKEIRGDFEGSGFSASEEMIEARSEEVLLEALSVNYINASMAEVAVLAKKHLKDMACEPHKPERFIAAAKEVMGIYATLKQSVHGKEPTNVVNIANFNGSMADMASLSDDELKRLIAQSEEHQNE
ncbi:MAG: helix-turn-helix domain-containing protein [Wolinella sp.]